MKQLSLKKTLILSFLVLCTPMCVLAKPTNEKSSPPKLTKKNEKVLVENKKFFLEGTAYVSLLYVKTAPPNKRKKM